MVISDSLHKDALKVVDVLTAMAIPVKLSNHESLIKSATTFLNSKVVSQYSSLLALLAVDSVLSVVNPMKPDIVNLRDIKIMKKLSGIVDDTELLSKSQDSATGDGTTTVVIVAGALLHQCLSLLSHDIHPMVISDSLHKAALKAVNVLTTMAIPVKLSDHESLIKSATTFLNSKVVSQYSSLPAPLAVDSILSVVNPMKPDIVDLRDIKIVKKLGGTVDDTELMKGLVFDKKVSHASARLIRMENAKIVVIQFQISPPKTNIKQSILVSDYAQMDRILKEDRLCYAVYVWLPRM
ncbi:T-complex protein 1 subunit delta [Quercus suber]|uniref:T-complex protein 1 subunit delta n=1 Tax=Quercus suber TaxID=58331 RepID=UPI000CE1825F|nr:T-complex protein 1 subunit delta-like [Quercus suber]POF03070.1 t-complex protein 1 subunit delta [Quercus suber]